MTSTRRAFTQTAGTVATAILALLCCDLAIAERAGDAPEPVVLARATSVVLDAAETHIVLAPVPPPRRPQPKSRPKTKGEKPARPQMQLVLRDVVARESAPAHDVFLVLEGPNVFEATTTRVQVGTPEPSGDDGGGGVTKRDIVTFNASEAFAVSKNSGLQHPACSRRDRAARRQR